MKIVQINATCGVGSTGKICVEISKLLTEKGIENYILHSSQTNGYDLGIRYADRRYIRLQAGKSRVLGNYGFNSKKATERIIAELERIKPDLVHLHNIHGHDCHLGMLFRYFKEKKIKLVWTFHDCWAFTAYCPHFVMADCDRWRTGCENCLQYRDHSFFFDRSRTLYQKKKDLFTGLDLTVVTPSRWLADLVKQSFLKDYPVIVINNGIDLSVFEPKDYGFRDKYGIPEDKKILLGVAFDWGVRKGLDVFLKLSRRLDPNLYRFVLVGTDHTIDQQLPSSILSIHRTQNQQELAGIYSAADLFINPTREDNYPTVNMESIACGTPVLTFRTGGSPECMDETCGAVVDCDDVDALVREIRRICEGQPYSMEACMKKAAEFDARSKYREYLSLYEDVLR